MTTVTLCCISCKLEVSWQRVLGAASTSCWHPGQQKKLIEARWNRGCTEQLVNLLYFLLCSFWKNKYVESFICQRALQLSPREVRSFHRDGLRVSEVQLRELHCGQFVWNHIAFKCAVEIQSSSTGSHRVSGNQHPLPIQNRWQTADQNGDKAVLSNTVGRLHILDATMECEHQKI